VESKAGNLDRATQVLHQALAIDQQRGDVFGVAVEQQSLAMVSLRAGRPREASDMLSRLLDYVVSSGDPDLVANVMELSACISAELGGGMRAARLAGAAETIRHKAGMEIPQPDADLLERYLAPARAQITREAWDAELAAGRALTEQDALALLTDQAPVR
jgi:hypothetical protein